MSWQKNLASKIVTKYYAPLVRKERTIFGKNVTFNDREQKFFMKFGEGFLNFMFAIGTYISYIIILMYISNKWGADKVMIVVAVMILAQMSNLTDAINSRRF